MKPPTGCAFHPRCPMPVDTSAATRARRPAGWRSRRQPLHQVACIKRQGRLMAVAEPVGSSSVAHAGGLRLPSLPQSRSTVSTSAGCVAGLRRHDRGRAARAACSPRTTRCCRSGSRCRRRAQGGFLLGSDSIGRDMLSRVLYGMPRQLVRRARRGRDRRAHRRPRRPDRRRHRRLGRQPPDAHHRRFPRAARAGAGHRRRRRARAGLHPHADRGLDRVVAVLRPHRPR